MRDLSPNKSSKPTAVGVRSSASLAHMGSFALPFLSLIAVLLCACRAPMSRHADDSARKDVEMVVLADLVANADKDASLVRFVDLTPTDLERLRATCGSRFEIFGMDKADRSGGILHLKNSSREGVHLEAEITKIYERDAEVWGSYVHLGGFFSSFTYKLHCGDGRWTIVSCEFRLAS
jgi:hypothetical protein